MEKKFDFDQMIVDEWRQLGFYYDQIEIAGKKHWRFFGNRQGLGEFVNNLNEYIHNSHNAGLSEHTHYGPYSYLKIMTWNKPTITEGYIAGSFDDLMYLKNSIADYLSITSVGQAFSIDNVYGIDNTLGMTFFVMPDDFDPASMDMNEGIVKKLMG